MRNNAPFSAASILLGLLSTSAIADITVDDTKKYIVEKSETCGKNYDRQNDLNGGSYYIVNTITKISFDENKMFIDQSRHSKKFKKNKAVIRESKEHSLTDVDLSTLIAETEIATYGKNRVILTCDKGKSCFNSKSERTSENKGSITSDSYTSNNSRAYYTKYVVFCNKDTASRMKKAFNHLIIKSGGKKELF